MRTSWRSWSTCTRRTVRPKSLRRPGVDIPVSGRRRTGRGLPFLPLKILEPGRQRRGGPGQRQGCGRGQGLRQEELTSPAAGDSRLGPPILPLKIPEPGRQLRGGPGRQQGCGRGQGLQQEELTSPAVGDSRLGPPILPHDDPGTSVDVATARAGLYSNDGMYETGRRTTDLPVDEKSKHVVESQRAGLPVTSRERASAPA